jgi:serine/threonine-protein kinase
LSTVPASAAQNEAELPVHPGQVLEGKFRIERIVGEGAMGLVAEATHLNLDERVALKFLRREARERPNIVMRFAREARAAAKITSDHVARVYDVGGTQDGSPFIVMEFLEGMDLEVVLVKEGRLDVMDAAEHVIQACEGLTAAHVIGVVHRDIKPANLFRVDRAGTREIKLLDFGISKAAISGTFDDIDLASADTTQIMGSPHYMSPEQIRSTKDVDARADLWSLGVVLYELITGATPFTATEVTAIIAQVLHEQHRPVRVLVPDIAPDLEAIIDRCLEKDPEKRYQSAADLAVALVPFAPKRARAVAERAAAMRTRASGQTPVADSVPPPPPSTCTISTSTLTSATASSSSHSPVAVSSSLGESTSGRRPLVWLAFAFVVLALGAALTALVTRLRQPPQTEPTASAHPAPVTPTISAETSAVATGTPAPPDTAPARGGAAVSTVQPAPAAPPSIAPTPQARPGTNSTNKGVRAPRPAGSKPGSAALPSTETDIRRER